MRHFLALPALAAGVFPLALAAQTAPAEGQAATVNEGGLSAYFNNWFARVQQAQSSQPSWMTPLVTVTPRLEEEVRYDQFWEYLPNGGTLNNFDAGKGLELIPTTSNEIIIGALPYEEKTVKGEKTSGFGDGPTLLIKQRLFSENAASGNSIVTAFLSVVPWAGGRHFTEHSWTITPTLAGGIGWGDFDIQATSGVLVPLRLLDDEGAQWQTNAAFQYHLLTYFWPEFEINDTLWLNGAERGGKNQVFLTPGLILGRFELAGRLKASVGAGYQVAVSPAERVKPALDPTYNHNWILSVRVSF